MRFLLLLACAGSLLGEFRAGAFKTVITPPAEGRPPVYMAGFGHNRAAVTVHDDLYARCLAFSTGQKPLVVCEVDLIGLFLDDVQRVRAKVPEADVVVASTHVHEGPDTMGLWGPAAGQSGIDEAYNSLVVDRVAEAAKGALAALVPATPSLAVAHSAELDSFINDDRPPVVHDPDLIVLSLTGKDGKRIATAVNWANHPETLGSRNTAISADYPGFFYKRLEAKLGGMAVLWNGAVGGMQSPLGARIKDPSTGMVAAENSFRKTQILGERIADLAADAARPAKPVRIDKVEFAERIVTIPVTNPGFAMAAQADLYKGRKKTTADGATTTSVGLIRMFGRRARAGHRASAGRDVSGTERGRRGTLRGRRFSGCAHRDAHQADVASGRIGIANHRHEIAEPCEVYQAIHALLGVEQVRSVVEGD